MIREIGQDEAWELARKITMCKDRGGLSIPQLEEIFGKDWTVSAIMEAYTYTEAAEKVKAWEEAKKPKVGDEYLSKTINKKFVIIQIDNDTVYVLWRDGTFGERKINDLESRYIKTGRTLSIEDWLKQIGGEEWRI